MSVAARCEVTASTQCEYPIGYLLRAADDVSSEQLEYQDRKAALQQIIDQMTLEALSWSGSNVTVSGAAADFAKAFLRRMPSNRELPKVAPDGEGGVLFVWEPPVGNCIVTVQEGLLHLLDQPGTPNVAHVDAQFFAGDHIPPAIMHALPMK